MSTARTILILDDDPSVLRALGRVMASSGCAWQGFSSAENLLRDADFAQADCIIADVSLPGMSGLELLSQLQSTGGAPPFIIVTANDDDEMRHASRVAGATAFFRKPVDSQALLDAVEWAIPRPGKPASKILLEDKTNRP